MLVIGEGRKLLEEVGIPLEDSGAGLIISQAAKGSVVTDFIQALAQHRHPERETVYPEI